MIDFGLKPCPLCGGEAWIESLTQDNTLLRATICCTKCGLTLKWAMRTDVIRGTIVQQGLDPIQAWNRRVGEAENG